MSAARRKEEEVLINPVSGRNSGTIWPIFMAIVLGSLGWMLSDQELRRGLAEITGWKALEPVLPEIHKDAMFIYGGHTSSCTQTVMLVAQEKEVEYEIVFVDRANKEQKGQEHLARNPFGLIPVVQIKEGEYLYESRAIAKYLAHRYSSKGTDLLEHGVLGHAYTEQAYNIEAFEFNPPALTLYKEAVKKPQEGGGVADETVVSAAKAALESKMDAYEIILSQQPYLAGQNLTLADLFHLPIGTKLVQGGQGDVLTDAKKRPSVARWWASLYERPSWQKVLSEVKEYLEQEEEERLKKEQAIQAERKLREDAERAFREEEAALNRNKAV